MSKQRKKKKQQPPKIPPSLRRSLETLVVFRGPSLTTAKDKAYMRQA